MDKSFLITTGNQHQYVYSDALCYFLYVPEEMATVMEHMDASLVDRTNYYERKLKYLKIEKSTPLCYNKHISCLTTF